MIQRYTNINGRLLRQEEASVPADDRSFRYGYGLFETMLALDGTIRHEERHWLRLSKGLETLRIDVPVRFMEQLRQETARTLGRHRTAGAVRVRVQVTAGSGGYFDAGDWKPFYLIECWPMPDFSEALNENGLVLGISDARKEPGPYSAVKSTNALCYALAARDAKASGWNDALLLNSAGNIVESCIANVFMKLPDRIVTPPLADGCVEGVMRAVIMARFLSKGVVVSEESISPKMLDTVEGAFLCNSLRGIRWIQSIDNVHFKPDFARRMPGLLR